jgi:hypothetical protein
VPVPNVSPYLTPPVPAPGPPPAPDHRGRAVFALSLAATLALVAGVARAWPDDGAAPPAERTSTTLLTKEAAAELDGPRGGGGTDARGDTPGVPAVPTPETTAPAADLFGDGPGAALQAVLDAAGHPDRLRQVTIFPSYLFVAYVDPARPDRIDRRMWREGRVGDPSANPIDDAVDASTAPKLFSPDELPVDRIAALVADAPSHYDEPVAVTHVIVDRFLPFDPRVLVRVYASPPDRPTGGGYVSYTADGEVVRVCC